MRFQIVNAILQYFTMKIFSRESNDPLMYQKREKWKRKKERLINVSQRKSS